MKPFLPAYMDGFISDEHTFSSCCNSDALVGLHIILISYHNSKIYLCS